MTGYTPPTIGSTAWGGPLNDIIAEIDTDMQDRAVDADVIHLTGDEAIAGVKTFATAPVVPDASFAIAKVIGLQAELDAATGAIGDAVTSVNEQTGTVTLTAADVSALADDATFDDLTDGATNVAFTTADNAKLDGIASGATANSSDATLLNRANHTGTQASTTISDFAEAVEDAVAAALVQGPGVTIAYNDGAGTITISADGGSGGALYARATAVYTTASLATDASETGVVALGPSFTLSKVEVDRPARVRLYASTTQRDADTARAFGTAPTGNHGLILDVKIDSTWFATVAYVDITPSVPGAIIGGGNTPITVTNLDTASTVEVTLTYQRTED